MELGYCPMISVSYVWVGREVDIKIIYSKMRRLTTDMKETEVYDMEQSYVNFTAIYSKASDIYTVESFAMILAGLKVP